VVTAVLLICVAIYAAAFVWGGRYMFWRAGKPERSTAAFWKWK
jgi:hypothetical protein